ncbi:histidine phosphatase family protein [Paenibacillus alkalitolerans]|uniref:histidine phosphatase family protein n=1 Tax=Paenibacillus alkalitolerans TaxID=2799335 RepID=UPI0018F6A1D4|nr:histidine phosphatase family protein [Paenibacillus alkalitolerans]
MNTTFYLVRHAIKEKGIGDVPISPKGILQAQATAHYFRGIPIHAVFSSPLRRAKETASYIASEAKIRFTEDTRLRERANWGELPEQTFDEFVAMWERCTRERDYLPHVGDSARQAGDRLSSFILEIAGKHPKTNNVIVTHGGLITDYLVNVFSEEVLNKWHPSFVAEQSSLVSECSITRVSHDGKSYALDCFASVEHIHE